ncbi:MAG: O-antigen ligase family protein [Bdellovibrio sp.]
MKLAFADRVKGVWSLNIWDKYALMLLFANAISWKLVDVVFVALIITVGVTEYRNKMAGLCKLISELKWVNILLAIILVSTTLGYALAASLGGEQIDELLGFRWLISFYACIYLGAKIDFKKVNLKIVSLVYMVVLGVGIFFQYFVWLKPGRVEGTFGNSNVFAFSVVIPWVCLLFWESLSNSRSGKSDRLLLFVLFAIAVMEFFAYGRGTWFAMSIAFIVATIILKNRRNVLILVGGGILSLVMFFQNIFYFKDRVIDSFNFSEGTSQGIRFILWKTNWMIFQDHPIFGIGFYENFRMLDAYYRLYGIGNPGGGASINYINHAHNQFLQVLVGSGVVGFIGYLGLLCLGVVFFAKCYRHYLGVHKAVAFSGLGVLTVFIVTGIVDCPLLVHESRNYLLIFSGILVGFLMRSKVFGEFGEVES